MLSDAPYCPYSRDYAPKYSKAAKALKEESSSIRLAKLDNTVYPSFGTKFGLRKYPTTKFFRNGKLAGGWIGGRTSTWILNWLKKYAQ